MHRLAISHSHDMHEYNQLPIAVALIIIINSLIEKTTLQIKLNDQSRSKKSTSVDEDY
jgi:hypothetical protein